MKAFKHELKGLKYWYTPCPRCVEECLNPDDCHWDKPSELENDFKNGYVIVIGTN